MSEQYLPGRWYVEGNTVFQIHVRADMLLENRIFMHLQAIPSVPKETVQAIANHIADTLNCSGIGGIDGYTAFVATEDSVCPEEIWNHPCRVWWSDGEVFEVSRASNLRWNQVPGFSEIVGYELLKKEQ